MRRTRRDNGDRLTLFPFLAVLICTMGSLIVLLVIIVQQARASADVVAREQREQVAEQQVQLDSLTEQVTQELEDVAWRIEMLQQSRDKTFDQLDRRRDELSYLEDEIRQLREQLERAATESDDIQQAANDAGESTQDTDQQLAELRAQLTEAEQELEEAREAAEASEQSYALVAYDGVSGTRRRPIYIECREDQIEIQPEGIVLTGDDFREPLTDDNALAAALRAQREFLKDAAGGYGDAPYPLLIVRPDGAQAYAAARAAMKSWDSEFGYELVNEDLKLVFPERNEALAGVTREAVEEARARRRMLQQIAPARFGRGSNGLLTATRNGGFASAGQPSGPPAGTRPGMPSPGMPSPAESDFSQGPNPPSVGTSGRDAGPNAFGGFGSDGQANAGAGSIASGRSDAQIGQPGSGGFDTGGLGMSGPRSGERGQSGTGGGTPAGDPRFTGGAAQQGPSATGRTSDQAWPFSNSNGPNGTAANDGASQSSQFGRSGNDASGAFAQNNSGAQGSAGAQGRGGAQAQGSAGASSGAGGGPGGNSGAGSSGGARGGAASASATASLAQSRGSNWALPGRGMGSTGITRPINLTCHDDRLVIIPENRYVAEPMEIPVASNMMPQIDTLVKVVSRRIDGWGIAGSNMYWKPVLQVDVEPGAERRYEELASLLNGSGIVVIRK